MTDMTDPEEEEPPANDNSETGALLVLIQNSWDLIQFAKTQQWRAAYYALLFLAAIEWVNRDTEFGNHFLEKIALGASVIAATAFAVMTIRDSHDAQDKARKRIRKCANAIGGRFYVIWLADNPVDRSRFSYIYAWFLGSFTVAGGLFLLVDLAIGA